jgi:membrane associated rhomboid family serine protease
MRAASVGFQCPECVREGAQSQRSARTAFGGLVPHSADMLTRLIIGVCVITFFLQLADNTFDNRFWLIGLSIDPELHEVVGVAHGQYYRLITSAFLHGGFLHLFFNMYALLIVGPELERVLGRLRFLSVYFLSALGGSTLAYVLVNPHQPTVGASGAIFGLFGALFVVARRLGRDSTGILALIVINLVITFTVPNISWQGHLGGLATGTVLAVAYAYAPRDRRALVQGGATAAVVAVIVIAVVMRTAALTP